MRKQQVIIYARQPQPPVSKEIEQSLLRGYITCGYCGRSLIVSSTEYRCSASSNKACHGVAIPIATIDVAVWNEALTQLGERGITLIGSDQPTCEENRQVLEMLGITVVLYREDDAVHNRYEMKQSLTTV